MRCSRNILPLQIYCYMQIISTYIIKTGNLLMYLTFEYIPMEYYEYVFILS